MPTLTKQHDCPTQLVTKLAETYLECLSGSFVEMQTKLKEANDKGVVDLARAFVAVKLFKDRLEEKLKPFNAMFEELKTVRLPEAIDAAGVSSVPLDEGYRVTVVHQTRASIRPDMKERAYDWLREQGLGDIISSTVNSSTLAAVARSFQEENRDFDDTIFNVHVIPTTSVTKVKGK